MGPLKNTKKRGFNNKKGAQLSSVGMGLGVGAVRGHGATVSCPAYPQPGASLGAGQEGTAAPGEAGDFAGSHRKQDCLLMALRMAHEGLSGQSPGRSWPCGVPVVLPTCGTPGTLLGKSWPNPA